MASHSPKMRACPEARITINPISGLLKHLPQESSSPLIKANVKNCSKKDPKTIFYTTNNYSVKKLEDSSLCAQ